jgi:hypothetical protein
VNHLAEEASPYLQQHKDNPVEWYPWGEEAFARARAEDKPVLLSVGYSACHWCHVMAHESFENADTAAVMNDLFVNVKVDREERPDVDAVYMEAVQSLTGHGGWPMTVFLAPDGRPFFGGTYFPKEARHGLPSFVQLCQAVAEAWQDRRDELLDQAGKLTEALQHSSAFVPAGDLPARTVLDDAVTALELQFDAEWGGFGRAPKFPQPSSLDLLLRVHAHTRSSSALRMVTTTLDAMASGGVYDHLGGGFHRYSVDAFWMVPHFEKMLYDQALLARVYLHAWQATGEARYLQVVEETVTYVMRDLLQPEGGIASAEDADSEGEEGRFYVWRVDEVEAVLPADEATAAVEWWGLTKAGNFEGANILHRPRRGELLRTGPVENARQALLAAREKRVRPGLDDKVLAEWNALFVATLAEAGAAAQREAWVEGARTVAQFLLDALRRADGRWLRSWQGGRAGRHLAYAADYAALVDAFTRLAEATGEAHWVAEARQTADGLLDLFGDAERGGVHTTGRDAEQLITRAKDLLDNATPAANSSAAVALLRLGALTGERRYEQAGEGILRLLKEPVERHPTAFAHLLAAVDLATAGPTEVVVAGDRPDLVQAVHSRLLPNAVLAWGERYPSPLWEGRADGAAYVCRHYACGLPATTVADLTTQLDGPEPSEEIEARP